MMYSFVIYIYSIHDYLHLLSISIHLYPDLGLQIVTKSEQCKGKPKFKKINCIVVYMFTKFYYKFINTINFSTPSFWLRKTSF